MYPSRYLSIYLSVCVSIYPSMYVSMYVFVYLSIHLCICLSICPYIHLCIYVSFYSSIYLSHILHLIRMRWFFYLVTDLSFHLFVRLGLGLSDFRVFAFLFLYVRYMIGTSCPSFTWSFNSTALTKKRTHTRYCSVLTRNLNLLHLDSLLTLRATQCRFSSIPLCWRVDWSSQRTSSTAQSVIFTITRR